MIVTGPRPLPLWIVLCCSCGGSVGDDPSRPPSANTPPTEQPAPTRDDAVAPSGPSGDEAPAVQHVEEGLRARCGSLAEQTFDNVPTDADALQTLLEGSWYACDGTTAVEEVASIGRWPADTLGIGFGAVVVVPVARTGQGLEAMFCFEGCTRGVTYASGGAFDIGVRRVTVRFSADGGVALMKAATGAFPERAFVRVPR